MPTPATLDALLVEERVFRPAPATVIEATPGLADAGCEVCHGPGSVHAETGDPAAIKGKLSGATNGGSAPRSACSTSAGIRRELSS